MVETKRKAPLGEILISEGLIDQSALSEALEEQQGSGQRLGKILIDQGALQEGALLELLSRQLNIPFIALDDYALDFDPSQQLPETMARRLRALVIEQDSRSCLVAMVDPLDLSALDEISQKLVRSVSAAVVREADLRAAFDRAYKRNEEISSIATELSSELSNQVFDIESLSDEDAETEAPVVRLLQTIFEDAVKSRASDIHIEPEERQIRIRQRVDGVLSEHLMNEARISSALVLRLKLMCGLNISEKRLPQDGRFNIRIHGRSIDVRLATMPTAFGESVVMRLLDQSQQVLNLEDTGMPAAMLERFKMALNQPHGMLLVTGPTGSGKTTTLYGALKYLNRPELKIVTVEDPIEYRMNRLTQIQVNNKVGLDFATVARASLRHDPDIMLVGEMRDEETVDIGLRSAMTGHLVLSTLHTNDAIASAVRLMDMKAEPYMIAGAIYGVLAQRLVRKLCSNCAEEGQVDEHEKAFIKAHIGALPDAPVIRQPRGCELCNHSGYLGRTGVFEWLEFDEPSLDALRRGDTQEFVSLAQSSEHYQTITSSALRLALEGVTSLAEAFKVAGYADL